MLLVFFALGLVGLLLLVMVDGGGHGNGGGTLERLASTVPTTMFNLIQSSKALGIDLTGLLGKLGVKEDPESGGGRTDKR
jgi:hypothetical protein